MLDINTLWRRHLNVLVQKGNKKKRREISKEKHTTMPQLKQVIVPVLKLELIGNPCYATF